MEDIQWMLDDMRAERKAHDRLTEWTNISESVTQLGELTLGQGLKFNQASSEEIAVLGHKDGLLLVSIGDLAVREMPMSGSNISQLKLSETGSYAVADGTGQKVTVGNVGQRAGTESHSLGEPNSFGFLHGTTFSYLNGKGHAFVGQKKMAPPKIVDEYFPRRNPEIMLTRMNICGDLILFEGGKFDSTNADLMRNAMFFPDQPPTREDYAATFDMLLSVQRHSSNGIEEIIRDRRMLNTHSISKILRENKGVIFPTLLHYGNLVAHMNIAEHPDEDMFYGLPTYQNLAVINSIGKTLREQQIEAERDHLHDTAISPNGDRAFSVLHGRNIQVIELDGSKDKNKLPRSSDPYPHRRPPERVKFFNAHNEKIIKLFTDGEKLCSVDAAGTVRHWQI